MFVELNVHELLPYLPMLFGISFGGGYQKSQSDSSSVQETGLSRGNRENLAQPIYRAVGPGGIGSFLESRATTPFKFPSLSASGFFPQQEAIYNTGFQEAVKQALSRLSGNFANRGFLNPENINAIAGSAAQNVAPQFAQFAIPQIGGNIMNQATVPEQVTGERLNQLSDFQKLLAALITGSSTGQSTGHSTSFGVQAEGSYKQPESKPVR